MAGIPMSALRRALAEMAEGAGAGVSQAYRGEHIMGGTALGAFGGGAAGGVADEMTPGEETAYGPAGVFTGAALGALGGGGAKGLRMIYRGIEEGARGGQRGLREALAEAAAERGIGRAAAREASHVDDAARFAMANEGQGGRSANAEAIEGILGRMTERGPEFDGGIDSLKSLLYYNVPGLRNNPRLQAARTAEELSAILDEAGADPTQWASRIGI